MTTGSRRVEPLSELKAVAVVNQNVIDWGTWTTSKTSAAALAALGWRLVTGRTDVCDEYVDAYTGEKLSILMKTEGRPAHQTESCQN